MAAPIRNRARDERWPTEWTKLLAGEFAQIEARLVNNHPIMAG